MCCVWGRGIKVKPSGLLNALPRLWSRSLFYIIISIVELRTLGYTIIELEL